ncbi:MAG TPA: hypothetical protein VGH33_27830 [Isosphaeraceae bacterium]
MPQRLTDVPLTHLIPTKLPSGPDVSVWSWRYQTGDCGQAIAYGELFWPDFLVHEDCVFCAEGFTESTYQGFMTQTAGNRRAVEAVMNHIHIHDLFMSAWSDATDEQLLYLGRLLREIWSVKLRHDFPDRRFVVLFDEDPTENGEGYEITFYQADPDSPTP